MGCVRPLALEQLMTHASHDPNRILWGAIEIGREAHLFVKDNNGRVQLDEDGNPRVDTDKVYYRVRAGLLDVGRNGRQLTSTAARIRASALGAPNQIEGA
jgi:hypothetical protein